MIYEGRLEATMQLLDVLYSAGSGLRDRGAWLQALVGRRAGPGLSMEVKLWQINRGRRSKGVRRPSSV